MRTRKQIKKKLDDLQDESDLSTKKSTVSHIREEEEEKIQTFGNLSNNIEEIESDEESEESVESEINNESSYEDDEKLYEILKCNTKEFRETFSDIKNTDIVKTGVLSKYTVDEIKRVMKLGRQNLKRERKEMFDREKQQRKDLVGQKRSMAQRMKKPKEPKPQKRVKSSDEITIDQRKFFQARFFLNHQSLFGIEIQNEFLLLIENKINSDDDLKTQTQSLMLTEYSKVAKKLYGSGDVKGLVELLNSLEPLMAILINIQISLENQSYMEESNTLQRTLLPFLDQVTDYSFLPNESQFIMSRFIKSLCDHIIDKQCHIKQGFILCSLKYDSSRLQQIIPYHNNEDSLYDALTHLNFSDEIATFIRGNYTKLLWPQLLDSLHGKLDSLVKDTLEILVKINIISDPGTYVIKLLNLFSQRSLIADELKKSQTIKIGMQTLLRVIETLIPQSKEAIIQILSLDSLKWEDHCTQNSLKGEQIKTNDSKRVFTEIYKQMTKDIDNKVDLEQLLELSQTISDEIKIYQHCEYQSTIAAIIASHSNPFVIAISPTGSGKTWIQGLIAKYYCTIGKSVTILEPNDDLRKQTFEKLSLVDYSISVMTIQDFYAYGTNDDIVIVNEYDMVIQEQPYAIKDNMIVGLWNLKHKKTIAFSATTSITFERFVNNCIQKPKVLKFKSEFELEKGLSPIQEPEIVNCKDQQEVDKQLHTYIEKYYDKKPLIVIYDSQQEQTLDKLMKEHNYTFFKGVMTNVLDQIKTVDFGIHLLESSHSRGIDIRFKVDSIVLIIAQPKTYHELMQMVGRSSRTRGVCESALFVQSTENSATLFQRLQRVGISEMGELEKLIQLLEKKTNEKSLIAALKDSTLKQKLILSIQDLKENMTEDKFTQLMKPSKEKVKDSKKQ